MKKEELTNKIYDVLFSAMSNNDDLESLILSKKDLEKMVERLVFLLQN